MTDVAMIEGAACSWPRAPRIGIAADGLYWHLAQSRTGAEKTTADFLTRYQFEVYYPFARVMRTIARRFLTKKQRAAGAVVRKPMLVPIFPGYLFVRFDMRTGRWHEAFDLIGVGGLVCAGDKPAIVDSFVDNIRGLEIEGAVPGTTKVLKLFSVGETARVNNGPFKGFDGVIETLPPKLADQLRTGIIEELDESMCASLALNIFGRSTPVHLPLGHLDKV